MQSVVKSAKIVNKFEIELNRNLLFDEMENVIFLNRIISPNGAMTILASCDTMANWLY